MRGRYAGTGDLWPSFRLLPLQQLSSQCTYVIICRYVRLSLSLAAAEFISTLTFILFRY